MLYVCSADELGDLQWQKMLDLSLSQKYKKESSDIK
jgi:hypothetical protein